MPAGLASEVQLLRLGAFHTCGVQSDGTLLCFGDNPFGQTTIPVGFSTAITVLDLGSYHTCAEASNVLGCWGWNI